MIQTQHSHNNQPKVLDVCAFSISDMEVRETIQRMKCKTQESAKAEQQTVTQITESILKT